jgi:hypothetical protein
MYKLQFSLVPTVTNQRQSESYYPLVPPLVNPFTVMQPMQANSILNPWCEGLYCMPFGAGPLYHWQPYYGTGPYHWQDSEMNQRAPSSGPSRTRANQQRKEFRKAGTPYLQNVRKSSARGTVEDDRSNDNMGCEVGKVWRTRQRT